MKKAQERGEFANGGPIQQGMTDSLLLTDLVAEICNSPSKSICEKAREAGISDCTIVNALVKLGLNSYVQKVCHFFSATTKSSRAQRVEKLLM